MGTAFRLEELDGQIVLVTFDVPGAKVNAFSQDVMLEFAGLLTRLEKRTDLKGLLFRSGKPEQFVAGADLKELAAIAVATRDAATTALTAGHAVFNAVSRLPFPTVALIDGSCLGGGTELTLTFDYRLAAANSATSIGLPEVQLGIIPAWGGTQRLPRLIGIHYAIEMICTGEPVKPQRAAELGLVFDAVPPDRLFDEGRRLIEHAGQSGEWRERRRRMAQPLGLNSDQLSFTFGVSEGQVRAKTKGHYPAPLAALEAMKLGVNLPLDEGLKIEQEIALEVIGSPISANLISIFFMTNKLARDTGVDNPEIKPKQIHRVGVLGAGQMGAGIATAHARSGVPAQMVDIDDVRLGDGLKRAQAVVEGRIKARHATQGDMQRLLSHLSTSTSHQVFADCDIVIEAVTENESLKTSMYRELAGVLRKDAILASNTSTISITRMSASVPVPEQFAGMHFFFPVDRMKLVEVIRGEKTNDETVATIVQLAKRIGKTPIVVKDCAGFLVNRILFPYMNEAVVLLQEGASPDAIDGAATRFGMPMGPIALYDLVGLDTACYAGQVVAAAYADRVVKTPLLDDLVKAGRLGQKSGAGFRTFLGKKSKAASDPAFEPFLKKHRTGDREFSDEELQDRLFLPMLLEAIRCLDDKIVREPGHVDIGLLWGIGFPPYRGGILRWCDIEGAGAIVDRLGKYAALGKRFEPTNSLKEMAKSSEKFYPTPKLNIKLGA